MSRWKHLATAPGVAVSLLPKFACPICASASLGVLSSMGLGYVLSTAYLLPVTATLLALGLLALAFRGPSRHGYGPFVLGVVAAAGVMVGKFEWESQLTIYAAIGLLLVSSVWNAWPRQPTRGISAACQACDTEESPFEK